MTLDQRAGTRNSTEFRAQPFDGVELRADSDGTQLTFTGYASVFNRSYQVNDLFGPFTEVIQEGAFRDSLARGADVPFKLNHEGMTLARTKSGTMQLSEDTHGLHVEAKLDPGNPQVQALRSAMDRGDIDEMSFAFQVTDDEWSADWMNRSIRAVDINKGDVSAVNYGASPHTAGAKLRSGELIRALRTITPSDLDPDTRDALAHALQLATAEDIAAGENTSEAKSLLSLYAHRLRLLSL